MEAATQSLQFIRSVISRFTPTTDMSDIFIGLVEATSITSFAFVDKEGHQRSILLRVECRDVVQ
ncbi:hypothetical protein HDU67_004442 [Dinochytrium kinnereticum]|nr:hypothetical protein HDU67_004442 [Dinochytrium kinnereticum]